MEFFGIIVITIIKETIMTNTANYEDLENILNRLKHSNSMEESILILDDFFTTYESMGSPDLPIFAQATILINTFAKNNIDLFDASNTALKYVKPSVLTGAISKYTYHKTRTYYFMHPTAQDAVAKILSHADYSAKKKVLENLAGINIVSNKLKKSCTPAQINDALRTQVLIFNNQKELVQKIKNSNAHTLYKQDLKSLKLRQEYYQKMLEKTAKNAYKAELKKVNRLLEAMAQLSPETHQKARIFGETEIAMIMKNDIQAITLIKNDKKSTVEDKKQRYIEAHNDSCFVSRHPLDSLYIGYTAQSYDMAKLTKTI